MQYIHAPNLESDYLGLESSLPYTICVTLEEFINYCMFISSST